MLSRLCWAIAVVGVLGLVAPAMAQNQQQGGAGEAKQTPTSTAVGQKSTEGRSTQPSQTDQGGAGEAKGTPGPTSAGERKPSER